MNKIWGLIGHLLAAQANWAACSPGTTAGQPQYMIFLSLAIAYVYKLAVPASHLLLAALESGFDKSNYVA